ncbi:MAG: Isopentenyl-diphosphate Delta-isomerase, partial [uncultured Nocardioidaceae bacterium]
ECRRGGRAARRERSGRGHRAQGGRPPREHAAAPRVLLLRLRRRGLPPAHPAGAAQAHLARGVDEQLLRAPCARRVARRGGTTAGRSGARRDPRRPRAGAAGVPLPGGDGRRHPGERDVSGVRRPDPRRGARRGRGGRRHRLGALGDARRRRHQRGAGRVAVVRAAGARPPGRPGTGGQLPRRRPGVAPPCGAAL